MVLIGNTYGCLTVLAERSGMYECRCKCGNIVNYDETTLLSQPKYCYYPVFISSRMTYSVKAANATYRKREKYRHLQNVKFVSERSLCCPSDEYCKQWNIYKNKQLRMEKTGDKRLYTIYDRQGKVCNVEVVSPLYALQGLYPNDVFELCPMSDIRNRSFYNGDPWDFEVFNNMGSSTRNKTRYYRRVNND